MKAKEQPIPLQSIIILPRWLMLGAVILCGACMLAGVGMIVYAIGWGEVRSFGGLLGGAIGCLLGGAGGLFGTLRDWNRRLPATVYLGHINNDQINPMYRKVFWPAVAVLVVGLILGCFVINHPGVWYGLVQTSAVLAFISGTMEAVRRHSTRQAQAVFALYADGALETEDAEAIDDARRKDDEFDGDVKAYLQISEEVRMFAAGSDWS